MHVEGLALIASGVAAAAVAGAMAWQFLAPKPRILPLAERKRKLAHAEEVFQRQFPKVPHVTVQQAQQLLQQQPDSYLLVDVRNRDEQAVSMVEGSNVLTLEEYRTQQELHQSKTALCYCTVGYRSSVAAQELMSEGLQAANLQGGILAWTQEGLPLVSGRDRKQPTSKVHTYGATWAYQGEGYEPVYYSNMYLRSGVSLQVTRQDLSTLHVR
eukprot:GHUV01042330.1.p1 GENE.GHUV01042330.1~~GHUV01042330.1.p1  ORF type:complete len:213 (+),score=39.95 GHUV01042330.1:282-920(+)